MLKNKRVTLIVAAIVFVAVIFFLKNKSSYQSQASQDAGLAYDNVSVKELLAKDTDLDGVPDWQENLEGTDPTKKETTPGIPDKEAIARIEASNKSNGTDIAPDVAIDEENLTKTDKFSRELFSTVATLNQTGELDQTTVDKLTTSLSDQIKNNTQRKVFLLSDLKMAKDDSIQAYQAYSNAINVISIKDPIDGNAIDILQEFANDGENANVAALDKLEPIVKQTTVFMNDMAKMSVPSSLAQPHLDTLNALEKIIENLTDVGLFDTDPIVAMGAMSKYEENTGLLQSATDKIGKMITSKLSGQ